MRKLILILALSIGLVYIPSDKGGTGYRKYLIRNLTVYPEEVLLQVERLLLILAVKGNSVG